jgi:hypothetical protein
VNGGTKLQELPEIKNYALKSAPTGQKGKERYFIPDMLLSKSPIKVSKRQEAPPLRLGAFARVFFYSLKEGKLTSRRQGRTQRKLVK